MRAKTITAIGMLGAVCAAAAAGAEAGRGEQAPAALRLDAKHVRYRLDGFGGNYCFGIESPVTQYTLKHLRVAWARTEMTPGEWEPTNDNASPRETNWDFLKGHDRPGTNLRREFLLAGQIQKRGIPYAISIWHLPEWLYAKPGKGPRVHRRTVPPAKWPELLECLGSYLVYAKKQYGVEPDLFSFNEADIGVRVLLSPTEHREAIKRIGAHFASLGLRTKMLLGDVCNARGRQKYVQPAASDPEAMKYVGAISFHSWGGASPKQYAAWGDLARKLKLPLLVGELGVDAGAWRTKSYRTFPYALRELRMYQEILLYARPQGTMQWEFTSDYRIVEERRDPAGGEAKLVPTARFWFVKHFCNLTPPKASALATTCDNANVLFTAFSGPGDGGKVYTLHLANFGAARSVTVTGLPPGVTSLRAVRSGRDEHFKELAPARADRGAVKTALAADSLTTLTTMPPR